MNTVCKCFTASGYFELRECLRFVLVRDRYQPDSSLDITMPAQEYFDSIPLRVQFTLDGRLLHDGIVREAQYT
jgi:hypothetical protein